MTSYIYQISKNGLVSRIRKELLKHNNYKKANLTIGKRTDTPPKWYEWWSKYIKRCSTSLPIRESTWKEIEWQRDRERQWLLKRHRERETEKDRDTERHAPTRCWTRDHRFYKAVWDVKWGLFIKHFKDFYVAHYRNYIRSHFPNFFPPCKFIFEKKDGIFRHLTAVTRDVPSHRAAVVVPGVNTLCRSKPLLPIVASVADNGVRKPRAIGQLFYTMVTITMI